MPNSLRFGPQKPYMLCFTVCRCARAPKASEFGTFRLPVAG